MSSIKSKEIKRISFNGKNVDNLNTKPIIPRIGHDIVGLQKIGGYYYWNLKFPFRHFKKEKIFIFYSDSIYEMSEKPDYSAKLIDFSKKQCQNK